MSPQTTRSRKEEAARRSGARLRRAALLRAAYVAAILLLALPSISAPPAPRVPVVVELFTSEGCSSCPPADAFLAQLDRTQPVAGAEVIPIEEHVDYWNRFGWRDPFSSAEITERQQEYARRLRISGPYTPQMVVDGRAQFSGNAGSEVGDAIAAAAKAPRIEIGLAVASGPPDWKVTAGILVNEIPRSTPETLDVYLAVTEDGLASMVSAGENSGRHLEHTSVLRRLGKVGSIRPGEAFRTQKHIALDRDWKRDNLRVVAFLAGSKTGHIVGAGATRIPRQH